MITKKTIEDAMYEAMRTAALEMPPDVRAALERALEEETDPMARKHLEISLKNADLAHRGEGLVCADTGFPLYFIKAGSGTVIDLKRSGMPPKPPRSAPRRSVICARRWLIRCGEAIPATTSGAVCRKSICSLKGMETVLRSLPRRKAGALKSSVLSTGCCFPPTA